MTYTLVGTGNMAWFLTRRLAGAGFQCSGLYGRDAAAAWQLASAAGCEVIPELHQLPEADCCILAVSDRSIGPVAQSLQLKQSVVIHTAGTVSLDVLPQTDKAILWFIYSISKNNLPDHRDVPVIYEAVTDKALAIVTGIADAISDIRQEADLHKRQWLHLSAVIGNNFTNHLMAQCEQICREQGLPFSLLTPILRQTFEQALHISPKTVQTGPAIRKDADTIEKHLDILQQHPLWQQVYASISASIRDMYDTGQEEKV